MLHFVHLFHGWIHYVLVVLLHLQNFTVQLVTQIWAYSFFLDRVKKFSFNRVNRIFNQVGKLLVDDLCLALLKYFFQFWTHSCEHVVRLLLFFFLLCIKFSGLGFLALRLWCSREMEVSYFFDLRDKDSETQVALLGVFAGRVVHLVDVGQLLAIFEAWLKFV